MIGGAGGFEANRLSLDLLEQPAADLRTEPTQQCQSEVDDRTLLVYVRR